MPELEMRTDERIYTVEAETWEEAKDKMMDLLPIEPFKREFKTPTQQLQEQGAMEEDDIVRPTLWIYQSAPLNIDHRAMSLEHQAAKLAIADLDDTEIPEDAEWIINRFDGEETRFFESEEEMDDAVKEQIIDKQIEAVKDQE